MKPLSSFATVVVAGATIAGMVHAQPTVREPESPVRHLRQVARQAVVRDDNLRPAQAIQNEWPSLSVPMPDTPRDQKIIESAGFTEPHENLYNTEAAKMFATRVQPVLNNVCAKCHARGSHQGSFKLRHVEEGFANPEATEHNLRVTALQLQRSNPGVSPLLMKAITPHGTSKEPPLIARSHPAFKHLELWAYWASLPEGSPMPRSLPAPSTLIPAAAEGHIALNQASQPKAPGTARVMRVGMMAEADAAAASITKNPNVTHLSLQSSSKSGKRSTTPNGQPALPLPEEPGLLPPLSGVTPLKTSEIRAGDTGFAVGAPPGPAVIGKPAVTDPFDPAVFNQTPSKAEPKK